MWYASGVKSNAEGDRKIEYTNKGRSKRADNAKEKGKIRVPVFQKTP